MIKSFNWWDDGDLSSAYVGDKGYDLGSRFAITGSATIAPGWSAGYNLTVRRNRHPCGRLTFHLPQYEVNLMKLTTITIMTAGPCSSAEQRLWRKPLTQVRSVAALRRYSRFNLTRAARGWVTRNPTLAHRLVTRV
jgi:hypothetical protein